MARVSKIITILEKVWKRYGDIEMWFPDDTKEYSSPVEGVMVVPFGELEYPVFAKSSPVACFTSEDGIEYRGEESGGGTN